MPRKPAVPHDDLQDAIHAEEAVVSARRVAGPSDPVWGRVADRVGNKITANYAYVYVKDNRHKILETICEKRGISLESASPANSDDSDSSDSADSGSGEIVVQPTTTFHVTITAAKWKRMKPLKKSCKRSDRPSDRVRTILPEYEWEEVIIDCLWQCAKIPCPYTFRYGRVYTAPTREEYIRIEAFCRECGASAEGRILAEPLEDEDVPLIWKANDTRKVPHQLKRPLRGSAREEVGKSLQGSSASSYRRLKAADCMDQGDPEPPTLHRETVLRKAKQQFRDKSLNIIEGKATPIQKLEIMKHSEPWVGSIHQIGSSPFFVMYWSPAQVQVYRSVSGRNYVVMSFDASGGVALSLPGFNNEKGPHLLLYESVVKAGNLTLPVKQLISERQDTDILVFWIKDFLKTKPPTPDEVVVDNSGALKSAIAQTFCRCVSTKDYCDKVYNHLRNGTALPPCYLRLDMNHIIGNASKWKPWKDPMTKRHKGLYLRCLGVAIQAENLDSFHSTFVNILIIAGSPNHGKSEKGKSTVDKSLQSLTKKIEGTTIPDVSSDDEDSDSNSEDSPDSTDSMDSDPEEDLPDNVKAFIDDIKQTASEKATTLRKGEGNLYYAPKVLKQFENLLPDFLLWSAVLVKAFKSPNITASSARVEGEFSTLKNCMLEGTHKAMRVDKFVATHLKFIEGTCRIAGSPDQSSHNKTDDTDNRNSTNKSTANSDTSEKKGKQNKKGTKSDENCDGDLSEDEGNQYENWRGKGTPKKRKQSYYLSTFPELSVALEAKALKAPSNRLLKNGSKMGFLKMGNSLIRLYNTCSFDAMAQLLTNAYIQYEVYRKAVAGKRNDLLNLSKELAVKGATQDVYKLRCDALTQIFVPSGVLSSSHKTRQMNSTKLEMEYNCEQEPIDMATTLLKDMESAVVNSECSNSNCSMQEVHELLTPNFNFILKEGLMRLSDAIHISLKMMTWSEEDGSHDSPPQGNEIEKKCEASCGGTTRVTCCLSPLIVLNVDFFSAPENKEGAPQVCAIGIKISEVPAKLDLCGSTYILVGIMARDGNHFLTYCRRANGQWESYNDMAKNVQWVKTDPLVSPVILCYVKLN